MSAQYDLHPIECAILELEAAREGRYLGKWSAEEMRDLKKLCHAKGAPEIGHDLYRAVVAENNGWSYRAGAADIDKVDQFSREWETYKNNPNPPIP